MVDVAVDGEPTAVAVVAAAAGEAIKVEDLSEGALDNMAAAVGYVPEVEDLSEGNLVDMAVAAEKATEVEYLAEEVVGKVRELGQAVEAVEVVEEVVEVVQVLECFSKFELSKGLRRTDPAKIRGRSDSYTRCQRHIIGEPDPEITCWQALATAGYV